MLRDLVSIYPNLRVPFLRARRTGGFHLPPRMSTVASAGQW